MTDLDGRPPEPSAEPPSTTARSASTTGLLVLAALYTLYVARSFLLPVVLALLLDFLFKPLVRWMKERLRVPEGLGAAVVLVAVLATTGYAVYRLSGPASTWMEEAPRSLRKVESKLKALKKPIEDVGRATAEVEKLTTVPDPKGAPRQVELKDASLRDVVFESTWGLLAGAVFVFTMGYFLLASGDFFLLKLVEVLPSLQDKKRAVRIARDVERQVSVYLVTTTLINVGLGVVVGLVLWWIGLPNPVLWAVMAAVLNFVPYLGALATVAILGLVGFGTFETTSQALMPALLYFVINFIESNFVTPWLLGRRLELNPVVLFLGLTFLWWIWGIPGALLAVPMLAVFKLFCDQVEPMAGVGQFLGR